MHADAQQLIEQFKQLLIEQHISPEQCQLGIAPVAIALTSAKQQLEMLQVRCI